MKHLRTSLKITLAILLSTAFAAAQETSVPGKHADPLELKTFYLQNATQSNEANELLTALRLMLDPAVRIYLDPTDNAILIRTTPDQIALAQRIISDLDRPRKLYRLTFTVTESESGKRVGLQHFTMVLCAGARTVLKDGSKLPIETGSIKDGSGTQMQMTYLDIGLNFDATVQNVNGGVSLKSKVEQSGAVEEHSPVGPQDPIVRQAVLEGTSLVALGKPLSLGAFDVPGSTRHLEFEVMAELVK